MENKILTARFQLETRNLSRIRNLNNKVGILHSSTRNDQGLKKFDLGAKMAELIGDNTDRKIETFHGKQSFTVKPGSFQANSNLLVFKNNFLRNEDKPPQMELPPTKTNTSYHKQLSKNILENTTHFMFQSKYNGTLSPS